MAFMIYSFVDKNPCAEKFASKIWCVGLVAVKAKTFTTGTLNVKKLKIQDELNINI